MFAYVIVIAAIGPEKLGRDMAEDNIDNASSDNEPELLVSNATRMPHPRF
jgi:SHS family lactate transporter-like MFS transporter